MKIINRAAIALAALAISATVSLAHDFKLGSLEITHPWSKAMPVGAKVAGGFMKIINHGTEPDRLVRVSSDIAGLVQIHEMKVEDGMMKMGEIPGGLEIAPGATVELAPGGLHVMFMNVKTPFKEGDHVKAVLTFEKAGDLAVEFSVGPANKGAGDHKMKM